MHMGIFKGKTLHFEVIWGGTSPINITGYQAVLQFRDRTNQLMLELSTGNGKVDVEPQDGKFRFVGDEADTRLIDRLGNWELELTAPNGDVYRALSGTVTPIEEIAQ